MQERRHQQRERERETHDKRTIAVRDRHGKRERGGWKVRDGVNTVFIRIVAEATINFSVATYQGRLLFKSGFY